MNWNTEKSSETQPSVDVFQRHIMENCVSIVVIKVQTALPGVLKKWINENLTENNLAEIPSLYQKTLELHVKENIAAVNIGLRQEFQKLCETKTQELCKMPLQKVSEVSQEFNRMIKEVFGFFGCFPDEEHLETIGINKMKNFTKNIDTMFVLPATKVISEKLMTTYKEKNKSILEIHEVKIQTVSNSFKRLYSEEMKIVMKNGPMRQSLLRKFHTDIEEKWLEVFEQSFPGTEKAIAKIREDGKERLLEKLEGEFLGFQLENGARLSNWVTQTKRHIKQMEADTKAKIEEFRGSTIEKLNRAHIHQISQIADKLKEGMDFKYKLLLKGENQSSTTDWSNMESCFAKTCIEKICGGKQLSQEEQRRKIHEALLNIYQDEMLEATRKNDPQKITNLHKDFMEECLMFCNKMLLPSRSTEELKNRLETAFKIVLMPDDLCAQYVQRMKLMKTNSHTICEDSNALLKYHNELKDEMKNLLETEAMKKLSQINTDFLQQLISLLENRMEKQFQTFENPAWVRPKAFQSDVKTDSLLLKDRAQVTKAPTFTVGKPKTVKISVDASCLSPASTQVHAGISCGTQSQKSKQPDDATVLTDEALRNAISNYFSRHKPGTQSPVTPVLRKEPTPSDPGNVSGRKQDTPENVQKITSMEFD